MTLEQLEKSAFEIITLAEEIRKAKNKDYAGQYDVLGGFRGPAMESANLTQFDVWWVYARKHWGAITKYINRGYTDSEPIVGRIADLINYLVFLDAMIKDYQNKTNFRDLNTPEERTPPNADNL